MLREGGYFEVGKIEASGGHALEVLLVNQITGGAVYM